MPRMKLSKALLDDMEVDTRTEIYNSVVRDLELRVEPTPSTVRTWFVRYTLGDGGERKRFKLGRYPDIPVTIAREMAKKVAADALNGKDPSGQRKEDRNALTVRDLGELFIERYSRRFKRTWREDQAMLVRDIYPLIGTKKASKVTKRDILDILETKLCQGKVPMARSLQVLLSKLFGWAVEQDYVVVSPVTTVKAPGVPAKRDRVLSPVEVRKLWNALPDAAMHPAMADIIRLLLLTGQRSGEVSGMRHSELDLQHALWTLPPARTKNGLEHSVPLSAPALEIITAAVARAEAAGRDALFSRTQTPVEFEQRLQGRAHGATGARHAVETA